MKNELELGVAAQAVLDAFVTLECACSLKERDSGHRVGCAVPHQRDALETLRDAVLLDDYLRNPADYGNSPLNQRDGQ